MAEVADTGGGGKHKGGKVRSKKMSTKVDFTPMVDLGFLLITFFMLTTTLNKPNIMAVVLPEDKKDPIEQPPVKESKVLTLLLGPRDKVFYYNGITDPKLDSTDYSAEGLRKIILDKMDTVKGQFGEDEYEDVKTKEKKKRSFTTVLIKASESSRYKNVVDALDEMAITGIKFYVLMDIATAEEDFIKNPAAGLKTGLK
jgi:biopolymer transport protein ExbD